MSARFIKHQASADARCRKLALEALEDRRLLASTPQVLDVNTAYVPSDVYDISEFTAVGDVVFFAAQVNQFGRELWKTDGTIDGTVQVKDIFVGNGWSDPRELTPFGGLLYFFARDAASYSQGNDYHLWRSDGTEAGTVQVSRFDSSLSPKPSNLTVVGDTLFFVATGPRGRELYTSDGTPEGTVLVKDISPRFDSKPTSLTEVNGTLFFVANDGLSGPSLWKSDGTAAGTVRVKDIHPGLGDAGPPTKLVNVNGTLFFAAHDDDTPGEDLWKSDGSEAGTVKVKAIGGPPSGGFLNSLTNVGGQLYFAVNHHTTRNGQIADLAWQELWTSNGTNGGTTKLLTLNVGSPIEPLFDSLTAVNDTLFFVANDGSLGRELWKATPDGATRVKDIRLGVNGSAPSSLVNVDGTLYFTANELSPQLWRSDGTQAGTMAVTNYDPSNNGLSANEMRNINGTLYFSGNVRSRQKFGYAIWTSDGTTAGTVAIAGTDHSYTRMFTSAGSNVFFVGEDSTSGKELWKTDGTPAGTMRVKDINPGAADSRIGGFTNVGGIVYFAAEDGASGRELWRSDGTEAGTYRVIDLFPGPMSGEVGNLTNFDGVLYFTGDSYETNVELWKTDGTAAGTVLVKDINPGYDGSSPRHLTLVGDTLYFFANGTNVEDRYELWKSDGTAEGTLRVKSINVSTHWSSGNPVSFGDTLYFSADDGANGFELWKSDGTEAGTVMVKDIIPGPAGSSPSNLIAINNSVFFQINVAGVYELWKSDGSSAGTMRVKSGLHKWEPVNVAGVLFFMEQFGPLWRSEGTSATTQIVSESSFPNHLASFNGSLYFTRNGGSAGAELWKTVGSTSGIELVADIYAGNRSSDPRYLTPVEGALYFTADSHYGREPWIIKPDLTAAARGDFDDDGDADGFDFLSWQRQLGAPVGIAGSGADGDGDGAVDAGDLEVWRAKFGEPPPAAAATAPQAAREQAALDAVYAAGDFTQLFAVAPTVKRRSWRPPQR